MGDKVGTEYIDKVLDLLEQMGTLQAINKLPVDIGSNYIATMTLAASHRGDSPEMAAKVITIVLMKVYFQALATYKPTSIDALRNNAPNN
jgi:hypothetical protein